MSGRDAGFGIEPVTSSAGVSRQEYENRMRMLADFTSAQADFNRTSVSVTESLRADINRLRSLVHVLVGFQTVLACGLVAALAFR